MAVRDKTATIGRNRLEQLHLAVAKQATVEIIEPRDTLTLSRRLNGINLDLVTEDRNFTALKTGQTIPWGTIRASGPSGTRIRYRVRTGHDVTGTPDFPF
ncbi:hypothetical protein AB0K02_23745 [Streptomyces sp. NPDC049597]|uniref:hypothetical protein n=1 Tax=Streptomyces sp. NPDC049597 TaxID=3155276 RepID=UPI003448EBFF